MLKNGNFIKLDGPKPANWIIKNSSGSSGTVTLDRKIFHSDGISMRMVKTNDQGRFDLMQTLNTSYLQRSRKVEFSAWVYAENVNKGYLIASAGSKNKKYMVWKYFRFNGTFEWRKIS
jgi:hypothetical protein